MYIEIIRHAESIANAENILQGQADSPLSETGKIQSQDLQQKLTGNYDAVYCSSLTRAKQTAQIGLDQSDFPSDKIFYLDELMEMDFGVLQGKRLAELTEIEKKIWATIRSGKEFDSQGGETRREFGKRVITVFQKIIKESKDQGNVHILIFTHGGVIKSLFQHKFPSVIPKIKNTSLFRIKIDNDQWLLTS